MKYQQITYIKVPVLIWRDDDIVVEHQISKITRRLYDILTNTLGTPKGVIKNIQYLEVVQ